VLGGGGGSGGFSVLFASVLWQPDGVSGFTNFLHCNGNTVALAANRLSGCSGGGGNAFRKEKFAAVLGSGGGAGGVLVAFSSAATFTPVVNGNTVITVHANSWHGAQLSAGGVVCPHSSGGVGEQLCGAAGGLAILYAARAANLTDNTHVVEGNDMVGCSAGEGTVDAPPSGGSGVAGAVAVLYQQFTTVNVRNSHRFVANRLVNGSAARRASAVRLLLGSDSSNSAAFSHNLVVDNMVTCDGGHVGSGGGGRECAGGAVVVDNGQLSLDGDTFNGNTGADGAAADLLVNTGAQPMAVRGGMIINTTVDESTPEPPTGAVFTRLSQPTSGVTYRCPVGYQVLRATAAAQVAFGCQRCGPSTYLVVGHGFEEPGASGNSSGLLGAAADQRGRSAATVPWVALHWWRRLGTGAAPTPRAVLSSSSCARARCAALAVAVHGTKCAVRFTETIRSRCAERASRVIAPRSAARRAGRRRAARMLRGSCPVWWCWRYCGRSICCAAAMPAAATPAATVVTATGPRRRVVHGGRRCGSSSGNAGGWRFRSARPCFSTSFRWRSCSPPADKRTPGGTLPSQAY
jgi:hypothetical protein